MSQVIPSSAEASTSGASSTATPNLGGKSLVDGLMFVGFLAGGGIVCCVIGMIFAVLDLAPYQMTRDAFRAFSTLQAQYALRGEEYPRDLWSPTDRSERGVAQLSPARMEPGLTLYSSAHESAVSLLDANGNRVHTWNAPYRQTWSGAPHVDRSLSETSVYIRRGHVYENGDLLALYETPMRTPNGIGLARLDSQGNVVWRLDRHAHHDFDLAPDGTIFVLTHEVLTTEHPEMPFLGRPVIDDRLTIVAPDGRERKTFSLMTSFARSALCRQRAILPNSFGDSLHTNTVSVVDPDFASHHPEIAAGQIMICARNLNLVFVIDPDSEEIVWATTGPWHHPHDPDPLPNGNLLIFDNYFVRGSMIGSRVIEFDARSGQVVWEYFGDPQHPLDSIVRACQQPLANGNVLITESTLGRLIEVDRDGEIVWEYLNPERRGDGQELIPILVGAKRLNLEQLPFLNSTSHATGATP